MTKIRTGMAMAAGLGTRMRPLTLARPKALVEVGGKTLLDHVLDRFAASGVERAVVNIHHFADLMRAHLSRRENRPDIVISDESDEVLETGGGLVKARPLLGDEPVMIANIDAIWREVDTPEIERMSAVWDGAHMSALLLLAPMDKTLGFDGAGDFFLDEDGRVTRRETAGSAPYAYAGSQILDPSVLDHYPAERFSTNRIWDDLLEQGRVFGLPMNAFWMHVGDPDAREAAEARLK